MATKILVIKLGYSETLDPEIGRVPSLGDVMRTTPILWALKAKYPESHITWLVTEHAEQILFDNKLIDRLLVWDQFVPFQLMKEKFDVLINLEKIPGVCALTDMIDAWVKYGFRFETTTGTYHGYEKGLNFISYIEEKKTDKAKGYWQQVLIEMLGVAWQEQPYILGYQPKTVEEYDIGFNYTVGSKWPFKALPQRKWEELQQRLEQSGYTVTWQQGKRDLHEYIDWINSCRVLVTNDSLGLHMAFARNKNVVAMFGPTDPNEVYFYNGHRVIRSETACPHMPCGSPKCLSGMYCMEHISVDRIFEAIIQVLPTGSGAQ